MSTSYESGTKSKEKLSTKLRKLENWFDCKSMEFVELINSRNLARNNMIRFGLVSLFNGVSTFVGYLMPKPFS